MAANLESFDRIVNSLSDIDGGWWPFLKLRPPKNEPVTLQRLALMSLAFGGSFGVVFTAYYAWRGILPLLVLLALPPVFIVFFFIFWGLLCRPSWNRRARRLSSQPTS